MARSATTTWPPRRARHNRVSTAAQVGPPSARVRCAPRRRRVVLAHHADDRQRAASAGTHAQDGSFNGHPYSAATDISVSGLSPTQIRNLLEKLAKVGFAAWYRQSGYDGWYGANHIHAVYANCKMKSSLRSQVRSWLAGRNGLVSNTIYHFHTFSAAANAAVKAKFEKSKHGTTNGGAGVPGRVNTAGIALHVRAGAR